jgi:cellulose synthase/poly-beta-1,6-N-acetylglucosamine synthase-like glycosyltransferase
MATPRVSVIIRTLNEERWIDACLRAVHDQDHPDVEIVLVDNRSTDRTLDIVSGYPVVLEHIDEFRPGLALNQGVRASSGEVLVFVSGHCVPVNTNWLNNLIAPLSDPDVAGVYGRQEPLSYTSDLDKRDLLTVFGLDPKVQRRDPFFHNANSAMRRDVWERFPFDEEVTNVEDRIWGREVIEAGMTIRYEPEASVYHWHGINHSANPKRARDVVRVIEQHVSPTLRPVAVDQLRVTAIVPIRGESRVIGGRPLLEETVRAATKAETIDEVIVVPNIEGTAELARSLGAAVPFLSTPELARSFVGIWDVVRYAVSELRRLDQAPDIVVLLSETYPLRRPEIIDAVVRHLLAQDLDTVIAARPERHGVWRQTDAGLERVGSGSMPTHLKDDHLYIGLVGLCSATRVESVRNGDVMAGRVGLYGVEDSASTLEVRDDASAATIEQLLARAREEAEA